MTRRAVRVGDRGRHRPWSVIAAAVALVMTAGCVPPPSPTTPTEVVGVDLAVGGSHTCAIQTGGEVWCWGANHRGQLGDGSTSDEATPVPVEVAGLGDAVALSLGVDSSCALLGDGSVWCWGANEHGQLGDGSTEDSSTPVQVIGVDHAVALGGGSGRGEAPFCAVRRDGSVACWGSGDQVATQVVGLGEARMVDASEDTICIVRSSGRVACSEDGAPSSLLPYIADAVEIDLGGRHSCAVLAAGGVRCWGLNESSQLGTLASQLPYSDDPVGPTTNTNVDEAMSATAAQTTNDLGYTCGVSGETRDVFCWGHRWFYSGYFPTLQIVPTYPAEPRPILFVEGSTVVNLDVDSVAAHSTHTCARAADRSVWCWGVNGSGQLGNGGTQHFHRGRQVVGLS